MAEASVLVTVRHAAKKLKLSKMTVYRWAKSGKIASTEVAGFLFIPEGEVDRINKERATDGSP